MADNKMKTQDKLNKLKEIRKQIYDESKNQGAMIYNKVEFLGKAPKTEKELYRVVEKYSVEENETEIREFFYELEDDVFKMIGIRNKDTSGKIIPTTEYIDNEDRKQEWEDEIQYIEKRIEERQKELEILAKELGISEEEIINLGEIDLEQKIENKEKENQEEKEHEQDKNEPQEISEEEAEKVGIKGTGMNSAKMDVQIDTKGNTLGKELHMEEYESILVIHSYKLAELEDSEGKKGKVNPVRFSLVGKKKDGTLEIIPETKLRPYRGANRQVTEINDRENVEVKNEECIFEVPNSNKRVAINQKDPYGIPEIYYGKSDKENEGSVMQSVQDERDGTQRKDVEVRALFNSNKGEYQIDKMHDEVQGHIKAGCDDLDKYGEYDGDLRTGHQHDTVITPDTVLIYDEKEMTVSQIAAEPRFNISADEFIKKYDRNNDGNKTQEEIYNAIEEEVNRDMTNPTQRT